MEKGCNGILSRNIIVLFILLFVLITSVAPNNNTSDADIRDIKWLIKTLNGNIRKLKESPDIKYEEKESLSEYENAVQKLSSELNGLKNVENDKTKGKIENIRKEADLLGEATDLIQSQSNPRKILRLTEECAEEVRRRSYQSAIKKLYLINDYTVIKTIVDKVYNGNKDHVRSIINFGDEIPSVLSSFEVYKSLKELLEANRHLDKYNGLLLIESLKTNIIEQLAAGHAIRSEATDLVDDIKILVKKWLVGKLGNAIFTERSDKEAFEISERITYQINDRQFFRDISTDVVDDYYYSHKSMSAEKVINVMENDMRSVPKLIFYNTLYEHIFGNGLNSNSVKELIMLQKAMKTANEDERKEFKSSTNELWKNIRNVENAATKRFTFAFLNGFYNQYDVDELSQVLFRTDQSMFEDVMTRTVNEIYGEIDEIDLITMMSGSTEIGQSAIGFDAIFNRMAKQGDLALEVKNIGALLMLEDAVAKKMQLENLRYEHISIVSKLKKIQNHLSNLKNDISSIFIDPVDAGEYNTDEYKLMCEKIFNSHTFEYFINNLVAKLYPTLNTEKLIDYVLSLDKIEQKILGLYAINTKLPKNDANLFAVAQNTKTLTDSKEYGAIDGNFKTTVFYKHFNSIPFSIRNAVFSKQVYIKNPNFGGEYLYISESFNRSKTVRQVFSHVTWKTGNRTKWILEYSGKGSVYRIKSQLNEYLIATGDEFNFDKDSRRVFAQTQEAQTDGDKWRLIPSDGKLYIKNEFYKEYLFAGQPIVNTEKRQIFTWKGAETSNSKWVIEDATSN